MKKIFVLLLPLLFLTQSCEDVIDVNLDTSAPRLVVDASINWYPETDGSTQTIKLTTTTAYFSQEIPAATGAEVKITDADGNLFLFPETTPGNYTCTNFQPLIGQTYTLQIRYQDEIYTATETFYATPDFSRVEQDNEGGILGEDIEIRYYFPDQANEDNFYYVRTTSSILAYPDLDVGSDEFTNGNDNFGLFIHEDLSPGIPVKFELHQVSERYYNYMYRILQTTNSGAGPFETASSAVRGNLVNQTNSNNYALGYFRLSEVKVLDYTVE